jgi:hypothetical protein
MQSAISPVSFIVTMIVSEVLQIMAIWLEPQFVSIIPYIDIESDVREKWYSGGPANLNFVRHLDVI